MFSATVSFGVNDNSSIRKLIESRSPLFLDISRVDNDLEAAEKIRTLDLDILVDITSHTFKGRIGITGGTYFNHYSFAD